MSKWWDKPGRMQPDEGRALEPGRWYVPIGNIIPAVRAEMAAMPARVQVTDSSLREAEDQPCHKPFTLQMKLAVAREVEAAGVTETSVGMPAVLPHHREVCRALRQEGSGMRLCAHPQPYTRPKDWKRNLDTLAEIGVDVAWLNFGATDHEIRLMQASGLGLRDDHLFEDLCSHAARVIAYAKSIGLTARPELFSPTKVPLERVARLYRVFAEAGADRVGVGDALGSNIPEATKFYVKLVKSVIGDGPKIAAHCHNDYGLANSNTVAAVTAGCDSIDVSVHGMGHRAGIAALELVVPILEILYGVDTGIRMERLQHLSDFVERTYGVRKMPHYPIVGETMWAHEDDSHVGSILLDRELKKPDAWATYNIINPEVFGAEELLQFSRGTISKAPGSALMIKIRQMGYSATDAQFDELARQIVQISDRDLFATEGAVEKLIGEILAP